MKDWKNLNKVRVHNTQEKIKHFIVKAMTLKLFFNAGYDCYSEVEIKSKVADVLAIKKKSILSYPTVVEIETKPTKKHNGELIKYYDDLDMNLYIIDSREVPDDIKKMEDYLKYKFGL